jgi:hypothetical protein
LVLLVFVFTKIMIRTKRNAVNCSSSFNRRLIRYVRKRNLKNLRKMLPIHTNSLLQLSDREACFLLDTCFEQLGKRYSMSCLLFLLHQNICAAIGGKVETLVLLRQGTPKFNRLEWLAKKKIIQCLVLHTDKSIVPLCKRVEVFYLAKPLVLQCEHHYLKSLVWELWMSDFGKHILKNLALCKLVADMSRHDDLELWNTFADHI